MGRVFEGMSAEQGVWSVECRVSSMKLRRKYFEFLVPRHSTFSIRQLPFALLPTPALYKSSLALVH